MILSHIANFLRVRGWIDKFQLNLAVALLIVAVSGFQPEFSAGFALFLFYMAITFSYGYLLNSIADRLPDEASGKGTGIGNHGNKPLMLVSLLGLSVLFFPIIFAQPILGAVNFLLSTFYSLKPFRLKETGFLGPIVASATQTAIPLLFFATEIKAPVWVLYFVVWVFLAELLIETDHHVDDYEADKKSGTRSVATTLGFGAAQKLVNLVFILFFAFSLAAILVFPLHWPIVLGALGVFSTKLVSKAFRI